MTYATVQQRTVERLRAFDAAAVEIEIERRLRWVEHCAAVHARGDVVRLQQDWQHLCAEARKAPQ